MNKLKQIIRNKKLRYGVIFLLVLVAVYSFARRDSVKTIPVKSVPIEKIVVNKTISATGSVSSKDDANLAFKTMGKIIKIYVSEGDEVQKGAILAQLDNASEANAVQIARDSRDVALRDREYFVARYQYNKSGAGGTEEYDITLRKYNELVSQAEANLALKQNGFNETYLYAPIEGTIYDVTKTVGESVSLGETVVKIANLSKLHFEVELDQEDYGLVKKDQKVEIELDAYPDKTLTGFVSELPLYANGGSSARFNVKISFDENLEVTPLMGMTGDVHIIIASTNEEVAALFYDQVFMDENDDYYVWTNDNGIIKKTPIKIGLEGDVYYQLAETPTNPVIVGLNEDITVKDGYKAKITQ